MIFQVVGCLTPKVYLVSSYTVIIQYGYKCIPEFLLVERGVGVGGAISFTSEHQAEVGVFRMCSTSCLHMPLGS